MPKYKNTRAGNKKRNIALQKKQKEEEYRKKAEECVNYFFCKESSIDEMTKWAKRVNIKFFRYYNENMIVGEMGDPKIERFVKKNLKKLKKERLLEGITIGNKHYFVRKEYFEKLIQDFQHMAKFPSNMPEEKIPDIVNQMKEAILKLIINPPKIDGELNNWSIGNAGSIWIDTEVLGKRIRLSFYNEDKDGDVCKMYNVNDFNPKFCVFDL